MQGNLHQSGQRRDLAVSLEQGLVQQLKPADMPERWPDTRHAEFSACTEVILPSSRTFGIYVPRSARRMYEQEATSTIIRCS